LSEHDPLHLFAGFGIELEYMLADVESLDVRPIADELLRLAGGSYEGDVERGGMAWSNELALHVIELKTNGPAPTLAGLGAAFQAEIEEINGLVADRSVLVLPTAMHPWMDPEHELRLWPHDNGVIYRTFDRIFDCRGHGWANLQSMHINLPFADDREFGLLHAAIRLVLPLIPGLAASSPFVDGKASGLLDTRLEIYRGNARRVPSVAGQVIPERVFTRAEYEQYLLGGIYADLAPLDADGVLRHEWVNSRGCIARFDRLAIEIRVTDVQECPAADLAIAAAVAAAVRSLVEQRSCSSLQQREWHERELAPMLLAAVRDADRAVIDNARYLEAFGFPERGPARVADLWQHVVETVLAEDADYAEWSPALATMLAKGCLARRILDATGPAPDRAALEAVYRQLAASAAEGRLFGASAAASASSGAGAGAGSGAGAGAATD
jgi:gamma-glutamyl:cysteine ligase YbdK (ATP-grasp superfamily)